MSEIKHYKSFKSFIVIAGVPGDCGELLTRLFRNRMWDFINFLNELLNTVPDN